MTRLLEELLSRASKLPPQQQDELAQRWIEELNDDAAWDVQFAQTQVQLTKLAAEVRGKILAGQVQSKGIDEL